MSSIIHSPPPKQDSRLPVDVLAGFFFLMGLSILLGLFYLIYQNINDAGTNLANEDRALRFLKQIGILRPILAVVASGLLIQLATRFRTGHTGALRWGRVVLWWAIVVFGLGLLQALNMSLNAELPQTVSTLNNLLPWGIALMIFGSVLMFLNRSAHLFRGDENVTEQRTRTAWTLLAPTLIILFVIGISPLEQVFVTSLTNERFASSERVEFVGLSNYSRVLGIRLDTLPCLQDPATGDCQTQTSADGEVEIVYPSARGFLSENVEGYREGEYRPVNEFSLMGTQYVFSARDREFINALMTSLVYSAVSITLQLILGLGIAMILVAKLRGIGALRAALLIPLAIPTLIATQFWDVMLLPNASGVANSFLLNVGLIDQPQRWLLDSNLQIPSLILVIVWKETPTMVLFLLPGLVMISPEIYQAASVDGANKWQQFWKITLPMMRPFIGVALILRTMPLLRVFDVFEILVGQRRFSLATYAHDVLVQRQQLGYSSTISVTIFIVMIVFTFIYVRSARID